MKIMTPEMIAHYQQRIDWYEQLVAQYDIPKGFHMYHELDCYPAAWDELQRYRAGEVTLEDIFHNPDNILRNMMLLFAIHYKEFEHKGFVIPGKAVKRCEQCNVPIPPKSKRRKYCSKDCAELSPSSRNHPIFRNRCY